MDRQMYRIVCWTVFAVIMAVNSGRAAEPVIIGVPHWEGYPYAHMMKNAMDTALEEVNRKGVNGRKISLVFADDGGNRTAGEKAVNDLIALEKAVMLVGGYSSSNTIYTALKADRMNRPFIICTAADDRITQRKMKNIFRMNLPASDYTEGLEAMLKEKIKPKSLGIVYENSPYGTGSALRMMWFCRENDIRINDIIPYYRDRAGASASYLERLLKPLKTDPPDVIFMVSYLKDGAALVKTIGEMEIGSQLCGGAGGFTHPDFRKMAGIAADHLLTATLWFQELDYPGTRDFYNRYMAAYGISPDYHGAEAYAVVKVAADALERAKSFDPAHLRAALEQTDLKTAYGPVKFRSRDKYERQNFHPAPVLQFIDGELKCVWPETLANAEYRKP